MADATKYQVPPFQGLPTEIYQSWKSKARGFAGQYAVAGGKRCAAVMSALQGDVPNQLDMRGFQQEEWWDRNDFEEKLDEVWELLDAIYGPKETAQEAQARLISSCVLEVGANGLVDLDKFITHFSQAQSNTPVTFTQEMRVQTFLTCVKKFSAFHTSLKVVVQGLGEAANLGVVMEKAKEYSGFLSMAQPTMIPVHPAGVPAAAAMSVAAEPGRPATLEEISALFHRQSFQRGRGRGGGYGRQGGRQGGGRRGPGGRVEMRTCYICNAQGHLSYDCPMKGGSTGNKFSGRYTVHSVSFSSSINAPITSGTVENNACTILIDSGASISLVSTKFAQMHTRSKIEQDSPVIFEFADGNRSRSQLTAHVEVGLGDYKEKVKLRLCALSQRADVILGMDWLQQVNPTINWKTGEVIVGDKVLCKPKEVKKPRKEYVHVVTHKEEVPVVKVQEKEKVTPPVKEEVVPKIEIVTAHQIERALRKPGMLEWCGAVVFATEEVEGKEPGSGVGQQRVVDPIITPVMQEFAKIFSLPEGLPPLRDESMQHSIDEVPDSTPPAVAPYKLSWVELEALKKILGDLAEQKLIAPSTSPYAAPCLLVRKKDGTFRLCVDYRLLNKQTVKDRYPLPRIQTLLDRLAGATVFTKFDLKSGYWQVRMRLEDEMKTSFVTPFGTFMFRVMPMGLANAPSTFQRIMDKVLAPVKDFVCVYLDDLLIFSKSMEEHAMHLRAVLTLLQKNEFYLNKEKCDIALPQVVFLGHQVGNGVIDLEKAKVAVVKDWALPRTRTELQQFLGFVNFYRHFINNFAHVATPLTDLLRGNTGTGPLEMTDAARSAFAILKARLCSSPTLAMPRADSLFVLSVDASNSAVGAVLQQWKDGRLQPVAYMSKRLSQAEANYDARQKELLAQVLGIEHFRTYLFGKKFLLLTDHHSLVGLTGTGEQPLVPRLVRWITRLSEYDYDVQYVKGNTNVAADALSRAPHVVNTEFADVATVVATKLDEDRGSQLQAIRQDKYFGPIVAVLESTTPTQNLTIQQRAKRFYISKGALFHIDDEGVHRRCVPEGQRRQVFQECHNTRTGGHMGVERTYAAMRTVVFWPKMLKWVRHMCRTCDTCDFNKTAKTIRAPAQPLEIPSRPWSSVSLDFMDMPQSLRGHNSILVATCRFSGQRHLMPTTQDVDAEGAAALVLDGVVRLHGIPESLVSDRDVRFTGEVWNSLWTALGTTLRMTTAHRPQADGKAEASNKAVQTVLRHFTNPSASDWDAPHILAVVELSLNAAVQRATGVSAFAAVQGYEPRLPNTAWVDDAVVDRASNDPASLATRIQQVWGQVRDMLHDAQDAQAVAQDGRARPWLSKNGMLEGSMVMLHTRNYPQLRPHKLSPRYVGPFKVKKVMEGGATRELEFPPSYRIHPVINVDQLKPYVRAPEDTAPEPGPVGTEQGQPTYEVERFLGRRVRYKKVQYLVRWKGFGRQHDSWEPESEVGRFHLLVKQWELEQAAARPNTRGRRGGGG